MRIGANPYIGRLNNAGAGGDEGDARRVPVADGARRDADLVRTEVSATRAQEIVGVAAVTMVLRPTFSIDFIRVTMILE